MSVPENLRPRHNDKTLRAMRAVHAVKRIFVNALRPIPARCCMFPQKTTKSSCLALRFDIDFQDLFLRSVNRKNMVPEGIQSEDSEYARSSLAGETRKPLASSLKTDWTKFRVASVASSLTMRSWVTMVCSLPRPFTMTSYSKQNFIQRF